MKILRQERHTVCFIEFEVNSETFAICVYTCQTIFFKHIVKLFYLDLQDVNSATNVHHNLQGAVIPSSGSIGMRIQYPLYTYYSLCLFIFLQKKNYLLIFYYSMPSSFFFSVWFSLTQWYIFKESIWEEKGRWRLFFLSFSECKWSPRSSDISVGLEGGRTLFLIYNCTNRMHLAGSPHCIHFHSQHFKHQHCFFVMCWMHIVWPHQHITFQFLLALLHAFAVWFLMIVWIL